MVQKIKKCLGILDNLDFDVWFDEETGCGAITLRHRTVTFTVLELIMKVADIVAVSYSDVDTYCITFMTK